ncbi:MAG: hypothetical protein HFG76_14775, partial [Hungatella sp.]|nr:hypothetical protein [Hungatella sp.]
KKYYMENLELCRQMYQESETVEAMNDLAISLYNNGLVSEGETRKDLITQSLKLWNRLCGQCPDIPLYAQRRDLVQKKLGYYSHAFTATGKNP